mmetsp:Transcript_2661/g.9436  ORF Transcript_2661/g.9436 Transcript_2661/m.9436 type:complete len:429 (+) Transcript_2661:131-1417(+)
MAGICLCVEGGRQLDEPLGLDGHDLAHVLLAGHDQLVVDDHLWVLLEERAARVDVDLRAVGQRLVALLGVLLGGVLEVAGADRLAHARQVAAARHDGDAVAVHDGQQLLAHVLRAPHRPRLHKVLEAPGARELGRLPGLVDGQQREVVALGLEELGLALVGQRLLLLGPVEDVLHREHGHDREHLVGALQGHRRDEDLGQRRLERELCHLAAQRRQEALVVEGAQRVQVLEGGDEGGGRRRVHELEVQQVVDAERLERQHGVGQVGALHLGHRRGVHFVAECRLGVQTEALARPGAACAACALLGLGARDGHHHERVHAHLAVVDVLLAEARVDHVEDAVHRKRGLGNVGGDDALARAGRRRLEDARLHLAGQGRVDGQDDQLRHLGAQRLHALEQHLAGGVDLLLAGEEEQDVAARLREVDLHDGEQ